VDENLIREEGFVVSYGVNGPQEGRQTLAFAYVPARAGGLGYIDHIRTLVHGEQQNRNTRKNLADFSGGGETVQHRHRDIEDYQIGSELASFVERFTAIAGLAANFHTNA
jgi:hypothetical protein